MKLFVFFTIVLLQINYTNLSKERQVLLSNQEMREVLKCFGDLNLEEGCVICRYVTQKIYKVVDISAMCPDIVETTLLKEREREWKPDPQVINKWTILYNLQKDYMNRILPNVNNIKEYDKVMHEKLKKEKVERENLANLRQFQEKVNKDLSKNNQSKFDTDDPECDDLKYNSNQVKSSNNDIFNEMRPQSNNRLNELNKSIMDDVRTKGKNIHDGFSVSRLDKNNKSILQNNMNSFFNKNNFKFKENNIDFDDEVIDSKNNYQMIDNFDIDKMISGLNLKKGEKVEYLGTTVGDINTINIKSKKKKDDDKEIEYLKKEIENIRNKFDLERVQNQKRNKEILDNLKKQQKIQANYQSSDISLKDASKKENNSNNNSYIAKEKSNPENLRFSEYDKEKKLNDILNSLNPNNNVNISSNKVNYIDSIKSLDNQNNRDSKIPNNSFKKDSTLNSNMSNNINNKNNQNNSNDIDNKIPSKEININSIQDNNKEFKTDKFKSREKDKLFLNNENIPHEEKIVTPPRMPYETIKRNLKNEESEPIISNGHDSSQLNNRIINPPVSFIEQNGIVTFDKNMFETLIKKSENYNLETQRRGRRRSRFPDPQWDCAEAQIAKLVRYLCEEEVSISYQKYCKPIFEQINTMIESYLYHDNNLEICQNLHMCPVSVDI